MKRFALMALLCAAPLLAQDTTAGRGRGGPGGRGGGRGNGGAWMGAMDSLRARQLYVSRESADLRGCQPAQCQRDMERKRVNDSIWVAHAPGNYELQKVKYKSRADGLEIPAYVYTPLTKSKTKRAAMVWVHQGLHGGVSQAGGRSVLPWSPGSRR